MPDRRPQYRYRGSVAPSAEVARPVAVRRHTARNDAGSGNSGSVATIDIMDVIDSWGGWWGISANDVDQALQSLGTVDTLYVRIHSPGGEADEGVAIANLLRAHAAQIRVTVFGLAASAASYIATAGDHVSMAPGARMMIHDASIISWGTAADLRSDIENLDSLSDSIASLYALKAGGTAAEWRARMKATTWYTADDAVTAGLAEAVGVDQAPSGPVETVAGPEGDPMSDDDFGFDSAAARFDLAGMFALPAAAVAMAVAGCRCGSNGGPALPGCEHKNECPARAQSTRNPTDPEEDGSMPDTIPTAGVCRALGLPSDADEDTILDALDKNVKAAAEPPKVDLTQVAAQLQANGQAIVPQAYLDTLKEGAEAGKAALARQRAEDRDKAITAAQDAGKIGRADAEVDKWRAAWDRDPTDTAKWIDDLPVRFPVAKAPTGYAGSDTSDGAGTKPFTDEEGDALAALAGLPAGVLR